MLATFLTDASYDISEAELEELLSQPESASVVAILLGMSAVLMVAGAVWYVLQVIAMWKIFTKAGEAGWKSLIPFYNAFVQYRITWSSTMFWVEFVLVALSGVLSSLDSKNGLVTVLTVIVAIALIVISVIADNKLAKSFGHGIGFTLGLIFLDPVFKLILAFGKSEYIGPNGGE